MFIELNTALNRVMGTTGLYPVFDLHPLQLSGYLDAVWEAWRRFGEGSLPAGGVMASGAATAVVPALGTVDWTGASPGATAQITSVLEDALRSRDSHIGPSGARRPLDAHAAANAVLNELFAPTSGKKITVPWRHLMYAYLIENTRAFEIFERVLHEALHDESLGAFRDETLRWIRTTEDLFFRDGTSSLISSITSRIRPDARATRRNAYQRMFGIDLNHGSSNGGAYNYVKSAAANTDFVRSLQDLLRELWRGYINAENSSGPNTTDTAAIQELLQNLRIMMNARRLSAPAGRGNLAREEFVSVAMMSWFDLALTSTSVVDDLRAHADQPEDRLRKVGDRVRMPSHGRSRSFFILANGSDNKAPFGLPHFLREIEEQVWDSSNLILLYDASPPVGAPLPLVVRRTVDIVNHWSIATGVDLKSVAVRTSQALAAASYAN